MRRIKCYNIGSLQLLMKKKREKKCTRCKATLPLEEFFSEKRRKTGKRAECKKCFNKKYNTSERNRRTRYGISENEYYTLLNVQRGKCRICDEEHPKLLVDHCHKTNIIRGLLCAKCNTGIGMLKDSVEIVAEALRYLLKYSKGI